MLCDTSSRVSATREVREAPRVGVDGGVGAGFLGWTRMVPESGSVRGLFAFGNVDGLASCRIIND
jgi:hypothetical protein